MKYTCFAARIVALSPFYYTGRNAVILKGGRTMSVFSRRVAVMHGMHDICRAAFFTVSAAIVWSVSFIDPFPDRAWA